jgi:hypothetical protein
MLLGEQDWQAHPEQVSRLADHRLGDLDPRVV